MFPPQKKGTDSSLTASPQKFHINKSITFMTKKNTSLGVFQVLQTGVKNPRVWKNHSGINFTSHQNSSVTDLCGEVSNLPEVFFDWNSMELSLRWWWWVPGKIQARTHCTPSRTVISEYIYICMYVGTNYIAIRNKISHIQPGNLNQSMWKLLSKLPKLSWIFAPKRPFHMFSLETHSWHHGTEIHPFLTASGSPMIGPKSSVHPSPLHQVSTSVMDTTPRDASTLRDL